MYENYPSSRKEAEEKGFNFYFNGKHCRNKHLTKRYTFSGACCECMKENRKKWRQKNKEKIKKYYEDNEKIEKYHEKYYVDNKETIKKRAAEWKRNNKDKCSEYHYKHSLKRKRLKEDKAYYPEDEEFMSFIMKEAVNLRRIRKESTGIDWHIDHIVPLNSEFVCGLHTEKNLQVITARENLTKSNKYWPNMPR